MSLNDASFILADIYQRAIPTARDRGETAGVRRAFRRAINAAREGDIRPMILLSYRYP